MALLMILLSAAAAAPGTAGQGGGEHRPRAGELGITIGTYDTGQFNSITDVPGVKVGHVSLISGENIRTGVTAIVPHGGNLFTEKVPGAVFIGNAFGKLAGATQVEELGTIETPILLCGTLNVPRVADALISYMISMPGNENVRSINPVVGETNDGGLNDIRGRHVGEEEVFEAISSASSGPVGEGSIGAGVGTRALGFKGGIGTSSRIVGVRGVGNFTVGVLVQTNFGGRLQVNGAPVGREINRRMRDRDPDYQPAEMAEEGSCMIVVATNAPLEARNLKRLAARAIGGMARSGASMSNGSGDYVLAFSTAESVRIEGSDRLREGLRLGNDSMSGLFSAVMDATEEAILNSLLRATTITGRNGATSRAIPIDLFTEICREFKVINPQP